MHDSMSRENLRSALDWVEDHLDHFDAHSDPGQIAMASDQRVAELAVALYCCTSLLDADFEGTMHRISMLLRRVSTRDDFFDRLIRSPSGLIILLYVHAALRASGEDDGQQREVLQRVVDAGYLSHGERPPYRDLDLRLALEWAEIDHDLPGWDALAQASILGRPVRVPFVDVPTAYAFTHAFFFAFALGTRPIKAGEWFDASTMQQTLSGLLVSFSLEHDWDLVGELLLCWECARLPDTPISQCAWEAFLARQQPDGAFLGPEKRGRRRTNAGQPGLTEGDPDRRYFTRHYHTTLVAIMALACRHAKVAAPAVASATVQTDVNPLPIDTDLKRPVASARRWALGLLDDLEQRGGARPDAICRLLVSLWMCDEFLSPGPESARLLTRISALLNAYGSDDEAWRSVPAGLRLMSATLLSARDEHVDGLEVFVTRVLDVLTSEPATGMEEDPELMEKRVLFWAAGLLPQPRFPGLDDVLSDPQPVPVDDPSSVDELVERLNACVGYGTRPVEPERGFLWIVDLLTGVTVHNLRVYDLSKASHVIRLLSALGPTGLDAARECVRYLLLQQHPSGSFGFFGPESGELARSVPGFTPSIDLQLPVMLDCLWALGECVHHPWRLYAAVADPGKRDNEAIEHTRTEAPHTT
jgi:hypothetical protein